MKTPVHSFHPISDASSRVLILGSMPGKASLRAQQYYAHPQNAFWKILGSVLPGFDPESAYEKRLADLRARGIALWDVMRSCVRESSLDSDIDDSSIVANPFGEFLATRPGIRTICFNGAKAEAAWNKHVRPSLPRARAFAFYRLPSTSSANASIRYGDKVEAWSAALGARCKRENW